MPFLRASLRAGPLEVAFLTAIDTDDLEVFAVASGHWRDLAASGLPVADMEANEFALAAEEAREGDPPLNNPPDRAAGAGPARHYSSPKRPSIKRIRVSIDFAAAQAFLPWRAGWRRAEAQPAKRLGSRDGATEALVRIDGHLVNVSRRGARCEGPFRWSRPARIDDGTMSFEATAECVTSTVAMAIAAASFVALPMWKVPAWAVVIAAGVAGFAAL